MADGKEPLYFTWFSMIGVQETMYFKGFPMADGEETRWLAPLGFPMADA